MSRLRKTVDDLARRLDRDEGGNVIVIYIAASLLLVGMLWAIIGSGARYIQKETLQTSADAAAFSAAVIKAKGLNMIAFLNLIMAALLAIIVMMRAIKYALTFLSLVCALCCDPYTYVASLCDISGDVDSLKEYYGQLYDQVEPRILDAMKAVAKVETAVNKTYPALALAEAARVGMHEDYKKNFGNGLVTITWPLPVGDDMSLPTEEGSWDELCDKAMSVVGQASGGVLGGASTGAGDGLLQGFYYGSMLCDVDGEKPKPLKLKSDWKDHKNVRAFSLLTDANVSARRKSVNVAYKKKVSAPGLDQLVSTAQAEFFPFYGSGHDDLWHMDWRARLIRFTLDSSSASADSSGGLSSWFQALESSGSTALADTFMVH